MSITVEELDRLRVTLVKTKSSLWELVKVYEITGSDHVEDLYKDYQELQELEESLKKVFKNKVKSLIEEESE